MAFEEFTHLVGILVSIGLSLLFIIWLFVVTGRMARRRDHSPWPWWIVGLLISPIVAIVPLWLFFDVKRGEDTDASGGETR